MLPVGCLWNRYCQALSEAERSAKCKEICPKPGSSDFHFTPETETPLD